MTDFPDAATERDDLQRVINAIRNAAIRYGVNAEVGTAIAHADMIVRQQRRRADVAFVDEINNRASGTVDP